MTPASLEPQSVHDLQALALKAARVRPRRRKGRRKGLSRAAHLHLIDVLSRWGGPGLAVIGGASIFMAVLAGRIYPLRTGVWVAMMFAALAICRRLRREFRSGEKIAGRPFKWRSGYAASLCVLGTAFGSGAILALPEGAPPGLVLPVLSLGLAGALGAGALHAPHLRSAAAIILPTALFVMAGAARSIGITPVFFAAAASAAASGCIVYFIWRALVRTAELRFPRHALQRRGADAEPHISLSDASENGAAAAS